MTGNQAEIIIRVFAGLAGYLAFAPGASAAWTCTYSICYGPLTCDDSAGVTICSCESVSAGEGNTTVSYGAAMLENSACQKPVNGLSTAVTSSVGTASGVTNLEHSLANTNAPVVEGVNAKGNDASGAQMSAIESAREVNELGANQAATVGAIFCAQGANAQVENSPEAPAYYANCKQNMDAAYLLKPQGDFKAHEATLGDPSSQKVLENFGQNFGVTASDYLKHMLGGRGGISHLAELVSEKISPGKLAAAMESGEKAAPSDLKGEPNQYAVDLGRAKTAEPVSSLRENLKKRLASQEEEPERALASAQGPEKYEPLTPATDDIFAVQEDPSLTIFDVVHLRYSEIRKRWRR